MSHTFTADQQTLLGHLATTYDQGFVSDISGMSKSRVFFHHLCPLFRAELLRRRVLYAEYLLGAGDIAGQEGLLNGLSVEVGIEPLLRMRIVVALMEHNPLVPPEDLSEAQALLKIIQEEI